MTGVESCHHLVQICAVLAAPGGLLQQGGARSDLSPGIRDCIGGETGPVLGGRGVAELYVGMRPAVGVGAYMQVATGTVEFHGGYGG